MAHGTTTAIKPAVLGVVGLLLVNPLAFANSERTRATAVKQTAFGADPEGVTLEFWYGGGLSGELWTLLELKNNGSVRIQFPEWHERSGSCEAVLPYVDVQDLFIDLAALGLLGLSQDRLKEELRGPSIPEISDGAVAILAVKVERFETRDGKAIPFDTRLAVRYLDDHLLERYPTNETEALRAFNEIRKYLNDKAVSWMEEYCN